MAKKTELIIGSYTVPGGLGRAAVARACNLVSQHPGIKQGDLMYSASNWACLNTSTSSWLTSPGPKSPAGILWDRKKDGRGFRCYPNSLTSQIGDARLYLQAETLKKWTNSGSPKKGDLVKLTDSLWARALGINKTPGILLGFGNSVDISLSSLKGDLKFLDDLSVYDNGMFLLTAQIMIGSKIQTVDVSALTKVG
jgi:hypothetical protein